MKPRTLSKIYTLNITLLQLVVFLLIPATDVFAQNYQEETVSLLTQEIIEQDLVSYPSSYFDKVQPVTALDMIKQVPGFQLDDNINNVRGFASTSGNVFIDDRRPSTKRDNLSSILTRIPATSVDRIELIRGKVRSIDLRGQSAVLNIVLKEGMPAAIQWESSVRQTFGHGPLKPEGRISLSDDWRGIDYNVGIDARRSSVGRTGFDNIEDGNRNLTEIRTDDKENRNTVLKANLNLAGWFGENYLQASTIYNYEKQHTYTNSDRVKSLTGIQRNVFFNDVEEEPTIEAGLDVERILIDRLTGKAIVLYVKGNRNIYNSQLDKNSSGVQTLNRIATGELDSSENIARLEMDWSGFTDHLLQFNAERAANNLNSTLAQTDDTGFGAVIIDVPGANGRVEEIRWDTLLKDTWTLNQLELDYGIGTEASTISQTGDAELDRSFFFVKPSAVATWLWLNRDQSRLRIVREIAQLNLEDFVSATEFLDNDIALGNPNIKPDATWKLEISHEIRFGSKGLVKLTAFHHWITDVLDLLPITTTFEAPGNIGDGRRWGLIWESSVPLDWIYLKAAKLDAKIRWQDSSVIDPVTGKNRVLSIATISAGPIMFDVENKYAYEVNFRQDFQAQKFAWGWKVMERAEQYQFKVNELLIYDENTDIHAYIETSRWFGIKMILGTENIFNFHEDRLRIIYSGERERSPVNTIETRDRTRGFRLNFTVSGSF